MRKTEGEHLVAYVRTSKVTDWKRLALLYERDGTPAFVYRSDDDVTFAEHAKEGAVLWIIESHKDAPPSLVARLQVVGQLHAKLRVDVLEVTGNANVPNGMLLDFEYGRKLRWYAVGDPNCSRFFGHNDVSGALIETDLEGEPARWQGAREWAPRFGQRLQRPRRLRSGQESLEKFAEDLAERSVFLSWKHCNFKERHHEIRALVRALADNNIECWWDQLALPRSRALNRLTKDPDLLKRLLDYGLAESQVLLALGSQDWGKPSSRDSSRNWTLGEWEGSQVQFAYEIDGPPELGWPTEPKRTFTREDSLSKVVNDIVAYFDGRRPVAPRGSEAPESSGK